MLDEAEFLSLYGIRSISKSSRVHPYTLTVNEQYRVITNLESRAPNVWQFQLAWTDLVPHKLSVD